MRRFRTVMSFHYSFKIQDSGFRIQKFKSEGIILRNSCLFLRKNVHFLRIKLKNEAILSPRRGKVVILQTKTDNIPKGLFILFQLNRIV